MPEMTMPGPMPGPIRPGSTTPAAITPQATGMRSNGSLMVTIAMKALQKAVADLDPSSEEGQDVLNALTRLSKRYGKASPDLQQSELKLLGAQAPSMSQGAPPQMKLMGSTRPGGPMAAPGAA